MASKLSVLLTLVLLTAVFGSPVPASEKENTEKDIATTTEAEDTEKVAIIEVVDVIPVVEVLESTTEAIAPEEVHHKLSKRSALRGDNPSNDLLANGDGFNYENDLAGIAGRRFKFLPAWVG